MQMRYFWNSSLGYRIYSTIALELASFWKTIKLLRSPWKWNYRHLFEQPKKPRYWPPPSSRRLRKFFIYMASRRNRPLDMCSIKRKVWIRGHVGFAGHVVRANHHIKGLAKYGQFRTKMRVFILKLCVIHSSITYSITSNSSTTVWKIKYFNYCSKAEI